jgi:uncharacterized membrane protein YciS (DUF1049 family)
MNIMKFYLVIALVVVSSLTYVHQHIEIVKLNYILKHNEMQIAQLLDHSGALMYNIDKLENPRHLEERLQSQNKAVFTMPDSWHVIGVAKAKEEAQVVQTAEKTSSFFDFLVPKALAQGKPAR